MFVVCRCWNAQYVISVWITRNLIRIVPVCLSLGIFQRWSIWIVARIFISIGLLLLRVILLGCIIFIEIINKDWVRFWRALIEALRGLWAWWMLIYFKILGLVSLDQPIHLLYFVSMSWLLLLLVAFIATERWDLSSRWCSLRRARHLGDFG